MLKNLKGPPFTLFGIVRFFKMNNCCLKIWFSQALHAISDLFFFQRLVFFLRDFFPFFLICFHQSPPSIFTRNETFCEHKGLLKVFGTMLLAGDLQKKFFVKISKICSQFRVFLRFSVEKDGFFAVSSWGIMVFESYAYPFGYFLAL